MKVEILTYDAEQGEYTPQAGVKRIHTTLSSLLEARRKLLGMGYEVGSPSVAILRMPDKRARDKRSREVRRDDKPGLFEGGA